MAGNARWKEVWNKRVDRFGEIDMTNSKEVFLELKRIDGFDVLDGGISFEALKTQNDVILKSLSKYNTVHSIFDVGCGCGSNLYAYKCEGLKVGGIDYSNTLINIAKKLFSDTDMELLCGEAVDLPTELKYDAIISNSVFSYFDDEAYAEAVLDKCLQKARMSIGLIDVHDIMKKDEFVDFRRRTIDDYEEKYKDLPKHFYNKDFFKNWANKHNLKIEFYDSKVEGYWNNDFVFNVFFYKNI